MPSLRRQTLQRGQSLVTSGAVSKQDLDRRSAEAANQQGLVKSTQANLDRLRVLEKYKRIVAPFDGLVTSRTTDVGALISAGSGGGPALFVVSDTSRLRAYVNVPQNYVPSVKIGTKAQTRRSGISRRGRSRRPSRPRRSPSTWRPARRACCSSSTMRPVS